jgi:hypothetical protein
MGQEADVQEAIRLESWILHVSQPEPLVAFLNGLKFGRGLELVHELIQFLLERIVFAHAPQDVLVALAIARAHGHDEKNNDQDIIVILKQTLESLRRAYAFGVTFLTCCLIR